MAVGNQIWLCLRLVLGSLTLLSYQKKEKEINNPTSSSDSSSSESSPCSSFSSKEKKYDVFLSFRGEDTRRGFIGYLYDALCKQGIHTYMDEQTLKSGHEISLTLMKAIEESKIYIVVLSQNFASSTWCLNELVQILKCKKNENVIPIFYGIDPSIVRKQKDSYAEAFDNHERRFRDNKIEKVKQWRVALEEVANLSGHDSKNFRYECKLVEKVVGDILLRLAKYQVTNYGNLIGIEEPVKEIESLLSIGTMDTKMDVRIIGIWGMGGIGKTTLAGIVFQRCAYSHFDGYCFLEDTSSEADNTNHLRYAILSKLLDNDANLLSTDTPGVGSRFIQDRLRNKKVFIILDNLHGRVSKLRDLFEGYQFANGSRIIVTSRHKQLLVTMAHAVYELKGLDHRDALQLFCFHAFGPNSLATGYEALIESVAHYAKGNPLALTVLGSSLKYKSIEEWESALEQLKTDGDPNILKVLRISFDGLGNKRFQNIFLDMACFFDGGMVKEDVESILSQNEHSDATYEIGVLIDKSLLIEQKKHLMPPYLPGGKRSELEMHNLLRQMGRNIVCDENKDAGKRSRLWNTEDVCRVLERNIGTSTIEGIVLNLRGLKRDVNVSHKAFLEMHNLRFLKIMHSDVRYIDKLNHNSDIEKWHDHIYLPNGLQSFVSNEIRYFHWDSCPLKNLLGLSSENLVEFIMRQNQLEQLWNEAPPPELVKLKKINLSFSEHLIEIPNLCRAINLQEIHLRSCTRLVHIPPFFQNLNKLQLLDMTECNNVEDGIEHLPSNLRYLRMSRTAIKSLPGSIWELKYLEELDLYGCTNLRKIPEISNHMECLVVIRLDGTEIEELPESIEHLTELKYLTLIGCHKIRFLPNSLCRLLHLQNLNLAGCHEIRFLPNSLCRLLHLQDLDLSRCHKIRFLPNSLCRLLHLQWLSLEGCSSLEELPPLPHSLNFLYIERCERLKSIAELPSSLFELSADNCTSLETISSRGPPSKPPFGVGVYSFFTNCLKLDEDTRNGIIADRARLLSYSCQDDAGYPRYIMYPGDEIPEWFSYQTDGGNSINIHLPPNWFELRFVLCIVFYELYNHVGPHDLFIDYEFNFKIDSSNSDDCLRNYRDGIEMSFLGTTDSDHVYIVSTVLLHSKLSKVFGQNWSSICSNITKASFRVSFEDQKDQYVHMIKKFGFQFGNADYGFEELNVHRASSNQPNGRKRNGDSLPHNNSKRIKLMG